MRKASAGIVNVTTTPLFFYLEYCELLYCFIGIIVIIVVVLMLVVEYILFLLLVVLAAVVIASVPAAVLWCLVDLLVVYVWLNFTASRGC